MKRKWGITLACLLITAIVCMFFANRIQTAGGKIDVSVGSIETDAGKLTYKLYVPETATEANPAPGVLLLHGYQNDHETCGAYAVELARRGAVVMALDEYGHGSSSVGLAERGYVNHKVTVNYGNESEADGTYVSIGGATRYRIMMNFSNLSFFDDYYTTDSDGNVLTDSSAGGISAYAVLADMKEVDNTRLAVSGHSMGTWSGWSVAAAYANSVNTSGESIAPRALVLQCGELFRDSVYDSESISFNNVLLLQAKYEEFSYFRDYQPVVNEELLTSDLRLEFLGCNANDAAWNTTYGDFGDGTARRIQLLYTNHRLTTHNSAGLTAALEWFDNSVSLDSDLSYSDHVALIKEILVLVAMLCCLIAMLPLMEILLSTKFFSYVAQPVPQFGFKAPGAWWKGVLVTVLIAAGSFPFMTQLGHGLLPLPEGIFRMTIGNGFLSWYALLIIIMIVFTIVGKKSAAKSGQDFSLYSRGLSSASKPDKLDLKLYGRSVLLVLCMVGSVYVINAAFELLFDLDLRFIWPFFKSFTPARFGQFCVYILIFAVFYLLNNSKIMAGMRTKAVCQPGLKGFLSCWWRNFIAMAGGLLLVVLIEYVPFFAEIGPGADLLFGSTFGGPFMSLLLLFVPQVFFFSIICTYCYRRTGNVCTGAFTVAALACWIVTGGSAML